VIPSMKVVTDDVKSQSEILNDPEVVYTLGAQ